jgi:hypothetical protein
MENSKRENTTIGKSKSVILSLGFMALLIFPTIQLFFGVIPDMPSTENRALSKKPKFKWRSLDPYPSGFEAFYTDNFSLRNHLIAIKSTLITKMLRKSSLPDKVIFGKAGMMYFVTNELKEYRGNNHLSAPELEKLVVDMLRRQAYLEERGIPMYLVIAPTKYSIYPEYLPRYIDRLNDTSRTAIIKEALLEKGINVMELRDTLIQNKHLGLLYYKTDNHWNELGSLITSNAIINLLRIDFPQLSPLDINAFAIDKEDKLDGNLPKLLNMAGHFREINYVLTPNIPNPAIKTDSAGYPVPEGFPYPWEYELTYETPADSLPSMLLIRDSFGTSLIKYLNRSFRRSVFIFDNWQYTSNEHIIEQEMPDAVVYLVLESLWTGFLEGVDISLSKLKTEKMDDPATFEDKGLDDADHPGN